MLHKRRYIFISIAAVIVIAAVVATLLVLTTHHTAAPAKSVVVKNDPAKDDPAKQEAQTTPDLSKDLGACTVITKATVVSALGSDIKTVGDPVNRGYARDNSGNGSQSCTFALASPDTETNRYSTTVTVFGTADLVTASKAAFADMTKVAGVGDAAYYETVDVPLNGITAATNGYNIYVFSGSKLYTLTITQPADSDVFTSNSAQAALTTIAKSISF